MELNFGRFYKRTRCPCCKTKFKYRETKDGVLRYVHQAGMNTYVDEQPIPGIDTNGMEVAKVGTGLRG